MNGNHALKTPMALLLCTLALATLVSAGDGAGKTSTTKDAASSSAAPVVDVNAMRIQGEQRFRANCGRCHAAPQKFPPRMMATVLRHMRVRATITDQDMRLVLFYVTQ